MVQAFVEVGLVDSADKVGDGGGNKRIGVDVIVHYGDGCSPGDARNHAEHLGTVVEIRSGVCGPTSTDWGVALLVHWTNNGRPSPVSDGGQVNPGIDEIQDDFTVGVGVVIIIVRAIKIPIGTVEILHCPVRPTDRPIPGQLTIDLNPVHRDVLGKQGELLGGEMGRHEVNPALRVVGGWLVDYAIGFSLKFIDHACQGFKFLGCFDRDQVALLVRGGFEDGEEGLVDLGRFDPASPKEFHGSPLDFSNEELEVAAGSRNVEALRTGVTLGIDEAHGNCTGIGHDDRRILDPGMVFLPETERPRETDCNVGVARVVDVEIMGFHDSLGLVGVSEEAVVDELALFGLKKEKVGVPCRLGWIVLHRGLGDGEPEAIGGNGRPEVSPGIHRESARAFTASQGADPGIPAGLPGGLVQLDDEYVEVIVALRAEDSLHIDEGLVLADSDCNVMRVEGARGLLDIPELLQACAVAPGKAAGTSHENSSRTVDGHAAHYHFGRDLGADPGAPCNIRQSDEAGEAVAIEDHGVLSLTLELGKVLEGASHHQQPIRSHGDVIDDSIASLAVDGEQPVGLPGFCFRVVCQGGEDAILTVFTRHPGHGGADLELVTVESAREDACGIRLIPRRDGIHGPEGGGSIGEAPDRRLIANDPAMHGRREGHDEDRGHQEGAAGGGNHLLL